MPRRYQSRIGLLQSTPPPELPSTADETEDVMGYPRPQLRRAEWRSLNGTWDFTIESETFASSPREVTFRSSIEVPFSPETPRSGVADTGLYRTCWYRKRFAAPELGPGQRLLVHFGAVDYQAVVWLNGARLGEHEGGYAPFWFDITDFLDAGQELQTLVVRADDDPTDLEKPRGKQDWQLEPHSIWYPRTTGIWQTVWL